MKKIFLLLLVILFSGCAGTYHVISEDGYNYYSYPRWHWNSWNYTYVINKPHHHIHKPNKPNKPNNRPNKPNNRPNKNKKR